MTANSVDKLLASRIAKLKAAYQSFDKSYMGPENEQKNLAWIYHLQELQNQEEDTPTLSWAAAAMSLIEQEPNKEEWLIARQCFEAKEMLAAYQKISNISSQDLTAIANYTSTGEEPLFKLPMAFISGSSSPSSSSSSVYNHVASIDQQMQQYESIEDTYSEHFDKLNFLIQETWLLNKINQKFNINPVIKSSRDRYSDFQVPENLNQCLAEIKAAVKSTLVTANDSAVDAFMGSILGPSPNDWPTEIPATEKNDAIQQYFKQAYSCQGFDFKPTIDIAKLSSLGQITKAMRIEAITQLETQAQAAATNSSGNIQPYLPPQDILNGIIAKETARKSLSNLQSTPYTDLLKSLAKPSASYPCLVVPRDFTLHPSQPGSATSTSGTVLGIEHQTSRVLVTHELELHSSIGGESFKIKQDKDKLNYFSDKTPPSINPDAKRGLMYSMIVTALINWKENEVFSIMARDEQELREMYVILHECVDSFKHYDTKLSSFPLDKVEVPQSLRRAKLEILDFYATADMKKMRKNPAEVPAEIQDTFKYLAAKPKDELQDKFNLTSEAIRIKLLASLDKGGKISDWVSHHAGDLSKVPHFKAKLQTLANKSKSIFSRAADQSKYLEEAKAILSTKTKPKS